MLCRHFWSRGDSHLNFVLNRKVADALFFTRDGVDIRVHQKADNGKQHDGASNQQSNLQSRAAATASLARLSFLGRVIAHLKLFWPNGMERIHDIQYRAVRNRGNQPARSKTELIVIYFRLTWILRSIHSVFEWIDDLRVD